MIYKCVYIYIYIYTMPFHSFQSLLLFPFDLLRITTVNLTLYRNWLPSSSSQVEWKA